MNTARIRPADAMTGAWGLALFVFLFLDWYTRPQGGVSAWGAFGVLDLLLALVALALVLTGPVVDAVAGPLGIGSAATTVWDIAKWPVLLLVVVGMFTVLFFAAPNVRVGGIKNVIPGVVVGLVVWIAASVAFAFYVANFGSYNKTYGSLGGVVAFLVWLWITNIAILLGAEFNAELQRSQQIQAGHRGSIDEPFLEPRDVKKLEKKL